MEQKSNPIDPRQPITIEQVERMIEIIDTEIVREGESISQEKLDRLTKKMGVLMKELATLKGEPIEKEERGYQ